MPRILVTAFEPFSSFKDNSSEWTLEEIRMLNRGGEDVRTLLLPVSYDEAPALVLDELAADSYNQIVMLGMGESSSRIRIETVARNWDDSEASDNVGVVRRGQPIVPDAPETLLPSYPRDVLMKNLRRRGIRSELSEFAGGFVCNHTYFVVAAALTEGGDPFEAPQCTFIHLPPPLGIHGKGGWSRFDARNFALALTDWFRTGPVLG